MFKILPSKVYKKIRQDSAILYEIKKYLHGFSQKKKPSKDFQLFIDMLPYLAHKEK